MVYDQKIDATHGNKMRLIDLMVDGDFLKAIEATIESLESISRTANNQRSKYKRLHIRHAALTMDTKDLSKLLLQKAGDLPEPQHTIIDAETGNRRPCRSHEEVMESTQKEGQEYTSPSNAKKQLHCVDTAHDKVGPSGIKIVADREISHQTMSETVSNYVSSTIYSLNCI